VRHLTPDQAAAALRRGKPVEQLLECGSHDGERTVSWLSVAPSGGEFTLTAHHVYDDGRPDFRDVTEFTPVDEWEGVGEGVEVARCAEPAAALQAATRHGASSDAWVNFSVIGDEYAHARGWS